MGSAEVDLGVEHESPVHTRLTVIVVTSPVRSHPSTALIETTMEAMRHGEGLQQCRKIIVCDGYRKQRTDTGQPTKRHMNASKSMRSGIVDEEGAEAYDEFKQRLERLACARSADTDSMFFRSELVTLTQRLGYGHALLAGLKMVTTPYVLVVQVLLSPHQR